MAAIQLSRTFSPTQDLQADGEDWSGFFGSAEERLTWRDLQEKPLVVILGEAGIGKTTEFELEVERLQSIGKPAFFVALNQISNSESWDRALAGAYVRYKRWRMSNETAYFFLDAVDEARLRGPADFEQALSVVPWVLSECMPRVRFVISSRPTDCGGQVISDTSIDC